MNSIHTTVNPTATAKNGPREHHSPGAATNGNKRSSVFYLSPTNTVSTNTTTSTSGSSSISPARSRSSSISIPDSNNNINNNNNSSNGSTPSPRPLPRYQFSLPSHQDQQDNSDSESWTTNSDDKWIHAFDDLRNDDVDIVGNQIVHDDGSVVELTERQLKTRQNRILTLRRISQKRQLMKQQSRPQNVREMFVQSKGEDGAENQLDINARKDSCTSNNSSSASTSSCASAHLNSDSNSESLSSLHEMANQSDYTDGSNKRSVAGTGRNVDFISRSSDGPSSGGFNFATEASSSTNQIKLPISGVSSVTNQQKQRENIFYQPQTKFQSKFAASKNMYRSTPNLSIKPASESKFSISTRLKNFFIGGKSKQSKSNHHAENDPNRNRSTSNSSNGSNQSGNEKGSPILGQFDKSGVPRAPRPSVASNLSQPQQPTRMPLSGQRSLAILPISNNANVSSSTNANLASTSKPDVSPIVRNHKKRFDTEDESYGIKIRYIKYNASYRQLQKHKHKKVFSNDGWSSGNSASDPNKPQESDLDSLDFYQLLEPITLTETDVEELDSFSYDFGVNFHKANGQLQSLSIQSNVTFYEGLTKNLTETANKVALYELEADLETAKIKHLIGAPSVPMPRFKDVRKKSHPNLLFGGYLSQLHKLDKVRGNFDCPSILKHMIEYISEHGIHEEGIFRLTGTHNRISKLKDEITTHYQNQFYKQSRPGSNRTEVFQIFERYTVHDVASLLKLFLRELAQPLLTEELMEIFLLVPSISSVKLQAKILNLLMLVLNETHRKSLCHLLDLLNLVVQNQHLNKMSLENVATVMAPNLFVERISSSPANHLAVPSGGHHGLSSSSSFLNLPRMSVSSMTINELVSSQMANYLERTGNSMLVLKLLVNLQPVLFHIPPCIYRQMKYKVNQ